MKKAVIFDLDGLLIDSEVISHRLYDELLHRYGKSVTVAEYARDYSGKTGVANMTNVIARYNLPITVEEGLTWEVAREKELLQDVQLKPGAAALLSWLKNRGRGRGAGNLQRAGARRRGADPAGRRAVF